MTNGASVSSGVTAILMTWRSWITTKALGDDNEAVKATRSDPSWRDPPGGLHETTGDQHQPVGSGSRCAAQPHRRNREWHSVHHGRYGIEAGNILRCFAGNLARATDRLRPSSHSAARRGSDREERLHAAGRMIRGRAAASLRDARSPPY